MSKPTQPSEIAREVLHQLAMRRSLPTPDNYMALYHEIAGTTMAEVFPEKALRNIAAALPRNTAEQSRFARQLDIAVTDKSWEELKKAVHAFSTAAATEPLQWSALIHDLMLQLERSQAGLTPAKKREVIEQVLHGSSAPELLFSRMQSLLRSWSHGQTADAGPSLVGDIEEVAPETLPKTAAPAAAAHVAPPRLSSELQELIALLLENSIGSLLIDTPELAKEAGELAAEIRAINIAKKLPDFTARMKRFCFRLQFAAEDEIELKASLLHLLRLIIENISEVVLDDQLLHAQLDVVLGLIDQPPNLRQINDVERRMKDVIFKQGVLKKQLSDAQSRLKIMLASFVDRLADMSESTSDYHDKIEKCALKISQASDITELSDVIGEVLNETRAIQLDSQRSRDELCEMRQRVDETEKEVARLQSELLQASDMVRQDPLTGAINRKGLGEALEHEVARFLRRKSKLCIALLDIDNFKKINDTFGHQVGDAALVHLANVIRETIRPEDTLARYGGEEFVLLLPDTSLDDSVIALTRLQRELTRKFFMNNNEKLLITFSAGVAEMGIDEPSDLTLKRADEAMYMAKRAGKNRVVAA